MTKFVKRDPGLMRFLSICHGLSLCIWADQARPLLAERGGRDPRAARTLLEPWDIFRIVRARRSCEMVMLNERGEELLISIGADHLCRSQPAFEVIQSLLALERHATTRELRGMLPVCADALPATLGGLVRMALLEEFRTTPCSTWELISPYAVQAFARACAIRAARAVGRTN